MTPADSLSGAPLVVLDLQNAIDHADWGVRNNPDAEANIGRLLTVWRDCGWPVIHVKHNSFNATSHYRSGQIGNTFKSEVEPITGEKIISKTQHSAFINGALQEALAGIGTKTLILAGVKTNNSIEATVRHGSNLGYYIHLLADGCFTHDQVDWNGKSWSAEDVHAIALSNLDGEYCAVTTVNSILSMISPIGP